MLEDEKYLETLIRAGRTGPDAAQVERIEQRLEPSFRAARENRSGRSRHVFGARASKMLAAAVLGIGLTTAVIETRDASLAPDDSEPVARPVETPTLPMKVPVSTEPPASAAPEPESIRAAAKQHVEAAPSLPLPARMPPAAPLPTPEVAQSENTTEAPPPAAVSEVAPAQPERPPSVASEVAYLRRAQAALNADPARALALADEHPSRFPNGALVQEREVIAIDALVKLRRVAEARARVASFRARYPGSAHLAHVVSAVGDGQ